MIICLVGHFLFPITHERSAIEEMGMQNLYGLRVGNSIYINGISCASKRKIVETIIHERVHFAYPTHDNRHVECVCDAVAMKHRKGALTGDDLRGIIKSVNKRYGDKRWR